MTALFGTRRVSVSVAWRLVAGLLPTMLAVALVAGLFYYGRPGREAPRFLLLPAALLTLLSVLVTWANARYFANRIGRLAHLARSAGGNQRADEFDRIEETVGSLGAALTTAAGERARAEAQAAERRRDEATMLAGVVADSLTQLDGVRLPLHILLEAPFGELNDNQEELLRDARAASDAVDAGLRRLGQIAEADRGALPVQLEPVQVNDVVRSVVPLARAAAERQGARVDVALEPALPRAAADRARLAEALALVATQSMAGAAEGSVLSIATARDGPKAVIRFAPCATRPAADQTPPSNAAWGLARRLIAAQGGEIVFGADACEVRLPVTPLP
jgi:signal transduction histidine kinase